MDKPHIGDATHVADALVVGAGIAGLSAALELSRVAPDARIVVLTRNGLGGHGASPLAQGGIAAALGPGDSPSLHAKDTELAAGGLARPDLIHLLTTEGPQRVRELMELGARFDLDASGKIALGLEGAHSRRRIIHSDGDRTGAEVTRALCEAVRRKQNLEVLEGMQAVELWASEGQVRGAWAHSSDGSLHLFRAGATVLATGGPGHVYLRTTAPSGMDGDGLAMAARAGAKLRDLEFVQFHPTALNVQADPLPLVTEALRGAGAKLVNRDGEGVLGAEKGGELASRDRVARALWLEIQRGEEVFLDARSVLRANGTKGFPGVRRVCKLYGIDPSQELIPVTPAAHYHMGGIGVDSDGRTSLEGLWAVGEATGSGLHGANRLASNSLLEGLVFGPRAATALARDLPAPSTPTATERKAAMAVAPDSGPLHQLPSEVLLRIRSLMWDLVGVVRTEDGLTKAVDSLAKIDDELSPEIPASSRNLLLAARMIAQAALQRRESVGSHYREDSPRDRILPHLHSVVQLLPDEPGIITATFEEPPTASPPFPMRPHPSVGTGPVSPTMKIT